MRGAGVAVVLAAGLLVAAAAPAPRWDSPGAANPLLPGYFADPSIVRDGGRWYIFATIDPWGDDRLGLWTSENGRDWRFSMPNWPTKAAATSPSSGDSKVWAPSVVKAANGRWYMFVSVGSEVWVGSAASPAGPWADANGGKPLIAKAFAPDYHMIDAEAFIDDDGQAYLYWGSGWNWTNGHCFVVKLKPDMVTFDGTPRDVTPPNYFEGPFMVRQGKHYLLTYSDGKTTTDTYKVRYAIGDTPFGPFREGPDSPILSTDTARSVISPGHHAVFRSGGQPYILYHRQGLPFPPPGDAVLRQIAVDPLTIRPDGSIAKAVPSHGGAVNGFAARRDAGLRWRASGQGSDALHGPQRAADDNYATWWAPAKGASPQLTADLGAVRPVKGSALRMRFPTQRYTLSVEGSPDGRVWQKLATVDQATGSPIELSHPAQVRYLRLQVPVDAGVWEWTLR
ncbi:family 43 glycosylhydrolase [Sphingomonas sp. Leaf10]|uniref:family 43 glycosylhydrolase n=1 Tax=Sphingomonas sp. Leaf10 TaxID=1735676 RepID=UPI000701827A|nr:family 43 glycosylhydrolase [Sphingomonas sp. Leaf10]KQM32678.1 glycosyl hydrolase [Sphingomonas sp. Leaf10]